VAEIPPTYCVIYIYIYIERERERERERVCVGVFVCLCGYVCMLVRARLRTSPQFVFGGSVPDRYVCIYILKKNIFRMSTMGVFFILLTAILEFVS
jgi:hypothetical protein